MLDRYHVRAASEQRARKAVTQGVYRHVLPLDACLLLRQAKEVGQGVAPQWATLPVAEDVVVAAIGSLRKPLLEEHGQGLCHRNHSGPVTLALPNDDQAIRQSQVLKPQVQQLDPSQPGEQEGSDHRAITQPQALGLATLSGIQQGAHLPVVQVGGNAMLLLRQTDAFERRLARLYAAINQEGP